jgi:hypothetical protein
MRPVCVPCGKFMKPSKNGRCVLLVADGLPYQLWMGDEWLCERCQAVVVAGFGRAPVSEHFQENFASSCEIERSQQNLVEAA